MTSGVSHGGDSQEQPVSQGGGPAKRPGFFKRHGALIGWLAVLAVLVAGVYSQTDDPKITHSSALNTIFDSRWLVAGARLLLAVAILYLLLSIGVRVRRRQWVRSAGPVQTDAPTQAIADSQRELQQQLREARQTIDELTKRLHQSLEARQALLDRLGESGESGHIEVPSQGSERPQ